MLFFCPFQVEINEPEWSMLHTTSHARIKNSDAVVYGPSLRVVFTRIFKKEC